MCLMLNSPLDNLLATFERMLEEHPIPRLDDLLDELYDAYRGMNRKLGLYEWLVMPFGLTNVPTTFMRLMNYVLRSLIGKYVFMYFDDILVYSSCIDDHVMYVRSMLLFPKQECLYTSLEKFTFCTTKIVFLGYVVGSKGVKVDIEKVKAIQSWSTKKIVGYVRSFNGLTSFCRHFVKDFSTLITPLNEIVKKDASFRREESQERALQALKERLTNAHILALPNFSIIAMPEVADSVDDVFDSIEMTKFLHL
ncbi:Retrovirus-related Pol polyprotein from transposon 17.6, partial [Mucuna pruriens]